MTTKIAAFRKWAQESQRGDDFVYHRAGSGRIEAAFEHARKLHDAGLVFLFQRKDAKGQREYVARRCSPESHMVLDRVSASVKVAPSRQYLIECGALQDGPGRPRIGVVTNPTKTSSIFLEDA